MKILSIDPGGKVMGWARWRLMALDGKVEMALEDAEADDVSKYGMGQIAAGVRTLARGCEVVVVETPGKWLGGSLSDRDGGRNKGMNIHGVASLYQAIGAIRAGAEDVCPDVRLVTDDWVKYAVTGRHNARKYDVHSHMINIHGLQLPRLRKTHCSECRARGLPAEHSPDGADAVAIGHAVVSEMRAALEDADRLRRFKPRG